MNKEQIIKNSKLFKILSNIMIVIMIIAAAAIAISAVTILIAMKNVNINNGSVKVLSEEVLNFKTDNGTLLVTSEDKTLYSITLDDNELTIADSLIKKTTSKNATMILEIIMGIGLLESILLILIFNKVKSIFNDIVEQKTPFVKNTPNNLKYISLLYGIILVTNIIFSIVFHLITKTSITIDIPVVGIIIIVFIMYLGYISNYGYVLEHKETGN